MIATAQFTISVVNDGQGIDHVEISYAIHSSATTPPGSPITDNGTIITDIDGRVLTDGDWSSTVPTVPAGYYLWTRTITYYTGGDFSISYSIGYTGEDGAPGTQGVSVSSEKEQWYLSNSSSALTGGSWSYTEPSSVPSGKYLFGRLEFTMSDGSKQYSDAVYRSVINGIMTKTDEINNKITNKVWEQDIDSKISAYDGSTATTIRNRVSAVEQDLDGFQQTVAETYETISGSDSKISTAKSEIKQTTDAISSEVSKKVGNSEIISKINQSAETVQIEASKIDLVGAVTYNMLATDSKNAITAAQNTANTATEKSTKGLALKVNYENFTTENAGECYLHGYTNGSPADVDGYVYWNNKKITVPKKMLNPNTICPYYKTIFIVLRLSSASATTGTLYMVWYDGSWKYAATPTPSSSTAWTWTETTDIVLGQFIETSNEGQIIDAYLYEPPRNASHVTTTGSNAYGYSQSAVNWVSTNGATTTNATNMLKIWTGGAISNTTTIQGGWIATHTITANQLATDAIMSSNYIAGGANSPYSGAGTFLDLATGNIYMPNFGVDAVSGAAYFNGQITADSGSIGADNTNYWEIGTITDYDGNDSAAIIGHGTSYLQSGKWMISEDRINTQWYNSSHKITYSNYSNTYWDFGLHAPDPSASQDYQKAFLYIRKHANTIPTLETDWDYVFKVTSDGKVYASDFVITGGGTGSTYLPLAGGTITGNLTVNGTLTATASKAKQLTNSISINGQSFDGSVGVTVSTLGVKYGGTGATTFTSGAVLIGNGQSAIGTRGIRNNTTAGTLGWTSNSTDITLTTTNTIAYWNGAYSGTSSNLEYVKLGKLGNVVTHDISEFITSAGGIIDGSLQVTDLTAGNLVVTGAGRFTNGIYGDLTGDVTGNLIGTAKYATIVKDAGNNNDITIQYSGSGIPSATWFAAWNGYSIRPIDVTHMKTSLGLNNVDNTADANKSVNYATSAGSATKATQDADGNTISSTYLKLSGGTLTGDLTIQKTTSIANNFPARIIFNTVQTDNNISTISQAYIAVYDDQDTNAYGTNMVIQSASNIFLGGGESPSALYALKKNNNGENLFLTADTSIYIESNASTIANRLGFYLDTAHQIIPCKAETATNNVGSIGTSSYKWANVYATTLHGNLDARTFTIGNTGKSVNWSANVSWTLAEIANDATTSASGWMSKEDKAKLDAIQVSTIDDVISANTIVGSNGISVSVSSNGVATIKHANSAITAGTTSGTSNTENVAFGSTITLPKITYDAYGHITKSETYTFKLPAAPTTITGNAGTATKFESAQSITLSGDTTGTASSQGGWNIPTTTNRLSTITTVAGTDHATALKTYFDNNKATIPRQKWDALWSTVNGNGSIYLGYFISSYDSNPYGGFFVAHYNNAYYVGIQNGTYSQQQLVTSTNYTSYTVKKDGTGATGTWGISISGNAATASSVEWANVSSKPIDFITNTGALNTGGWSTLGGMSNGKKIAISYNNNPAPWNVARYSSTIVFGCNDVKGMLDIGHLTPSVSFGGGSIGGSTNDAPNWYFKLTGTTATTYNLDNFILKSGGTFTGTVTGISFAASSYIATNSGNSGTAGGLALYGTTPTNYGIAMRNTTNGGKHGYVQGDWGIYSYMYGSGVDTAVTSGAMRGWIFRNAQKSENVASISGLGNAVFNGSVTVGGNETNDTGAKFEYDENMGCINVIFN